MSLLWHSPKTKSFFALRCLELICIRVAFHGWSMGVAMHPHMDFGSFPSEAKHLYLSLLFPFFYVCCILQHTWKEENASKYCFCAGRCPYLHKNNPALNAGTPAIWCKGACITGRTVFVQEGVRVPALALGSPKRSSAERELKSITS